MTDDATIDPPEELQKLAPRDSEEQFRRLFEDSPLGMAMIADGRLVRVNAALARMLHYSIEEMAGLPIARITHPEDRHLHEEFAARQVAGEIVSYKLDKRYFTKDGQVVWGRINSTLIRDAAGKPLHAFSLIEDITERKLNEHALREREERLRAILASLHGMVLSAVDYDGRVLFIQVSPEIEQRHDVRESDLLGKSLTDIFPPDEARQRLEIIREVFRTGQPHRTQLHSTHPGGEFWEEVFHTPIRGPDGQVVAVLAAIADITDRRQAEETLRATTQRLQYVVDNIGDAIFEIDLTGRYTFASQAAERMTGYSIQTLLGMNMDELMAPEHVPAVRERLQRRLAGLPLEQHFCFDIVRKDGWRVTVELTTSPAYRDGVLVGVQGIARDITERRRAQEALRQSEERFRTLVSDIPGVVYRCHNDAEYTAHFISDSIQELTGYPAADFVRAGGRTYGSVIHPDDRGLVRKAVDEGIKRRRPYICEYRLRRADGAVRWVYEKGQPIFDTAGQVLWLDGAIFDVTERKKAQEALEQAQARLTRAREEERRRLAAELHDSVGQGLVALRLAAQAVGGAQDMAAAGGHGEGLAHLCAQCDRLIQEIRSICRGLYPPTLESLGLVSALRQLADDFQNQVRVAVNCSVPGAARFDPEVEIALFRVAQESINNALRHGQARRVTVGLSCADGTVEMTITDNGRGFKPAKVSGEGLGLTVMKQRVASIGGQLEITSRKGRTRLAVQAPARLILPGGD